VTDLGPEDGTYVARSHILPLVLLTPPKDFAPARWAGARAAHPCWLRGQDWVEPSETAQAREGRAHRK